MTVSVFLLCLAAGMVCGGVDGTLAPLRKRAGIAFTVLTDICLAFVSVGLHALVLYFYCNGQVFFYAVATQIAGYAVSRALMLTLYRAIRPHIKSKTAQPKKTKRKKAPAVEALH